MDIFWLHITVTQCFLHVEKWVTQNGTNSEKSRLQSALIVLFLVETDPKRNQNKRNFPLDVFYVRHLHHLDSLRSKSKSFCILSQKSCKKWLCPTFEITWSGEMKVFRELNSLQTMYVETCHDVSESGGKSSKSFFDWRLGLFRQKCVAWAQFWFNHIEQGIFWSLLIGGRHFSIKHVTLNSSLTNFFCIEGNCMIFWSFSKNIFSKVFQE